MKQFLYGILTGLAGMAIGGVGMILVSWMFVRLIRLLPTP